MRKGLKVSVLTQGHPIGSKAILLFRPSLGGFHRQGLQAQGQEELMG